MKRVYKVKAKVERKGVSDHWINIGTATALGDGSGRIYLTLEALPLHSDGVMVLYPVVERNAALAYQQARSLEAVEAVKTECYGKGFSMLDTCDEIGRRIEEAK